MLTTGRSYREPSCDDLVEMVNARTLLYNGCSATRLAEATMHRRIGAARVFACINERIDDRPISARNLLQLRAAFRAGPSKRADIPLGVSLHRCTTGSQNVDVLAAVAGCSHLSLTTVADQVCTTSRLQHALALHYSLSYLWISDSPAVVDALMQTVCTECTQVTTLTVWASVTNAEDERLGSILRSVAAMPRLQCLELGLGTACVSEAVVAPVLLLPRLRYLSFDRTLFTQAAVAVMVSTLTQRPRRIRAFGLGEPRFTDVAAARELFSQAGLQMMRHLYWLQLRDIAGDLPVIDMLIDQALPVMTLLQRLVLGMDDGGVGTGDTLTSRVLAAVPNPELVEHLCINHHEVQLVEQAVSLPQLASMVQDCTPGEVVAPAVQQQINRLSMVSVSGSMAVHAVLSVCRDLLPHAHHVLAHLVLPDAILTDDLADVLRDVLPCLSLLTEVIVRVAPTQRHLLRRVFSQCRPYALASVQILAPTCTQCVVPIELMRASLAVNLFSDNTQFGIIQLGQYYCHSDLADRPWPCAVPSLHDLCASFVLTQIPPDHDLGQVPEALSRHSLREQLMPCDECGAYRRLIDGFISVRGKPAQFVEVLRCFSCYVRSPGSMFPYPAE